MRRQAPKQARTAPHSILVYTDRRDRDRKIDSCLRGVRVDWRHSSFLSSQPKDDSDYLRSKVRRTAAHLARAGRFLYDIREVLARSTDPTEGMRSTFGEIWQRQPEGVTTLIIGDHAHLWYGRFEELLAVEEGLQGHDHILCCYRAEGFWSLDPKWIARMFELHRKAFLDDAVLEMAPRPS